MSWRDELHRIPTRNRALLGSLVDRRIVRVLHYAEPPEELLEDYSYVARGVTAEQLFSLADGPVVVATDDGAVCIFDCAEVVSVAVEVASFAELAADWPVAIEATDATYSQPRFMRLIGRRIVGVRVLQMVVDPDRLDYVDKKGIRTMMSSKILDRPREVAVVFDLDDGSQLVVGRTVIDAPADLAVMTGEDLLDARFDCSEVLRLPGRDADPADVSSQHPAPQRVRPDEVEE